jgi:hypothetical protein
MQVGAKTKQKTKGKRRRAIKTEKRENAIKNWNTKRQKKGWIKRKKNLHKKTIKEEEPKEKPTSRFWHMNC